MREVTPPLRWALFVLLILGILGTSRGQQKPAQCKQGKLNVVIAMDASQSLTFLNFLMVKEYTQLIARNILSSDSAVPDTMRLFVVTFAEMVDRLVDEPMNLNDTIRAIDNYDKPNIPKTNTNFAIDVGVEILLKEGDPNKPMVILIVTDGRSTGGIENLVKSSQAASLKGITTIAVGVGTDYAKEELRQIANQRMEHVINGTFANLNTEVLSQTMNVLCQLAVTNASNPVVERPKCTTYGTVAIGVEVSPAFNELENHLLVPFVGMLSPDTHVAVSDGHNSLLPFQSVVQTINSLKLIAPLFNQSLGYPERTLGSLVAALRNHELAPKVAILIIDGSALTNPQSLAFTKMIAKSARNMGTAVIGLVIGHFGDDMQKKLSDIFGSVNKLVTLPYMDAILTSGYNQLLNRLCTVLSTTREPTTPPTAAPPTTTTTPAPSTAPPTQPIPIFDGPINLHVAFDVCQETTQYNIQFETYEAFARILVQHLHLDYSAVSFMASLIYCSGAQPVARSPDNLFESHESLSTASSSTVSSVDATSIITYIVNKRDPTVDNVGIIFITEGRIERGLDAAVAMARSLGITLIAVYAGTVNTGMEQKAMAIDAGFNAADVTLEQTISRRFPALFEKPVHVVFGITLNDTPLPREKYTEVDAMVRNFRNSKYTDYVVSDIKLNLETSKRGNISRAIEYILQRNNSIANYHYIIIVTNKPPPTDVDTTGIAVFYTGYTGEKATSALDIKSTIDRENTAGSKVMGVMIESSEGTSLTDMSVAFRTIAGIISSLRDMAYVEINTFDSDVHLEVPRTPLVNNSMVIKVLRALYKIDHLMQKPPLHKALELSSEVTKKTADTQIYVVAFLESSVRYPHMVDLLRIVQGDLHLIVVDVSRAGNIDLGLTNPPFVKPVQIIRAKDIEFDKLPWIIMDKMDATGFTDFHTIFVFGQLQPFEVNFPILEIMLNNIPQAKQGYSFHNEFGLVTMEQSNVFGYLNLTVDQMITALQRLMKVSDRGSEMALDYSVSRLSMESDYKMSGIVILTDEPPKFQNKMRNVTNEIKDIDGMHTLAMGLGQIDRTALYGLTNVGDNDDVFVAANGTILSDDGIRWLINKLGSLSPINPLCNGKAEVGFGVTSSIEDREVFLTLQDELTLYLGDEVKFKFISYYNSQLYPNQSQASNNNGRQTDPKALQYVTEQAYQRIMNVNGGRLNQVIVIFTDGESSRDGISGDILSRMTDHVEWVVLGIGQFSTKALADLRTLTRGKVGNLILVGNAAEMESSQIQDDLQTALCAAVEKPPIINIRTNITQICADLPIDHDFGIQVENVRYPFDCRRYINCRRMGTMVTADVFTCPSSSKFNANRRFCDVSIDAECKEVTAEEFDLETGNIIDPPIPKPVNLTEECINNCFKAEDPYTNYGYTYHPKDCSKFIVCHRNDFSARVEHCPLGQFWDYHKNICLSTYNAECKADPCEYKTMYAFRKVSCRSYYRCHNGRSILQNCAIGTKFQFDGRCVDDMAMTCDVPDVNPEICRYLPWIDRTKYVDLEIADGTDGRVKLCPPGKWYDHQACACSILDPTYEFEDCPPLLSQTMDLPGIFNNVIQWSGMATFTGNGIMRLSLPSTLTSEFFIHIKVGVSKSFQNVNVLKSCLSGVASGISLHLANDELIANLIFNDGSVTLKAKLQMDKWQDVYLGYDGQNVVLYNGGIMDTAPVSDGELQGCPGTSVGGFELGGVNGAAQTVTSDGFFGEVDEIHVFSCVPEKYQFVFA